MSEELGKSRWFVAGLVSLVAHIVLLGIWLGIARSGDSASPDVADEPDAPSVEKPAEGATSAKDAAAVQDSAPPDAGRKVPSAANESDARKAGAPSASSKPSGKPATVKPKAVSEGKKPSADKIPGEKASAASDVETATYVVKKGDNLSKIATAHGLTLQELTNLNKATLKKSGNLWVGQKIKVPKLPAKSAAAE